MEINSVQNSKVKTWMKYHQKKYRDTDEKYLIEGEHLIEEALKVNVVDVLLVRKGKEHNFGYHGDIYVLEDHVMDKLSKNVSSVNYIAVCKKQIYEIKDNTRLLLLDAVQDPGNMGTIIRSAHSFGFDGIYLSEDCVDIYNEKVIRSTQGALFHLPIINCDLQMKVEELQKGGVEVVATALNEEAVYLGDYTPKASIALIMGNEGSGVKESLIKKADKVMKIEMANFESLNVAIAASICMYELRKG
ncbi:TrmH family RNA methyltransferase [Breznakia pachnodae]|uniref:TrmH family RNA methyltransferase n=1 Tax=Breznakia pachnodae TaxID=265178 RepID=A0ABU0DXS1_9FIRM|nr:RNA methyltransferase [Breznakia pachnodae]MDQ0359340.1 TrmH family RNA methyltransferase [Breznakia pachnodae]